MLISVIKTSTLEVSYCFESHGYLCTLLKVTIKGETTFSESGHLSLPLLLSSLCTSALHLSDVVDVLKIGQRAESTRWHMDPCQPPEFVPTWTEMRHRTGEREHAHT